MTGQVQIDREAIKELSKWKHVFVKEVCERAKLIAASDGSPTHITILHYRQAAESAVQTLCAEIQQRSIYDDKREAA